MPIYFPYTCKSSGSCLSQGMFTHDKSEYYDSGVEGYLLNCEWYAWNGFYINKTKFVVLTVYSVQLIFKHTCANNY